MSQSLAAGALCGVLVVQAVAHAFRHWRPRRGAHRAGDPLPVPYASFHDGPIAITPLGQIPMGWRRCPAERVEVEVIVHEDGSATCDTEGCRTHIPATAGEL